MNETSIDDLKMIKIYKNIGMNVKRLRQEKKSHNLHFPWQ